MNTKSVTTKREMNWSKLGINIPKGTKLEVYFKESVPSRIFFNWEGRELTTRTTVGNLTFTGFNKMPGAKTLERYSWDSVAGTPTGCRVEPDGFGPDGSPSWLLVLGLI